MRRPFLLLAGLLLAGCGGQGGSTASTPRGGRATVRILWPSPASARVIPLAAGSIVVTVSRVDGTGKVTKTIPRPATTATSASATLTGLPYGRLTVTAQAFPTSAGTGVAQSFGAGEMDVSENVPGSVSFAMGSTVATLSILPSPLTVASGGRTALTASAKDAQGNVVLLAANGRNESLAWSSDDPSVDTVSGTGPTATLTNVGSGTANVAATLTTTDGGATVSTGPVPASVAAPVFGLSPAASFTYGYAFATVSGATNNPTWLARARVACTLELTPAATTATSVALTGTGPLSFSSSAAVDSASASVSANTVSLAYASLYATHVDEDTPGTVTGTTSSGTATGTVLVKANPLASLAVSSSTVKGGSSVTGTVTLGLYALASEGVALACSDPSVTVPAAASVAAPAYMSTGILNRPGYRLAKTATFSVRTSAVSTPKTVTISASRAGVTKTVSLTINP